MISIRIPFIVLITSLSSPVYAQNWQVQEQQNEMIHQEQMMGDQQQAASYQMNEQQQAMTQQSMQMQVQQADMEQQIQAQQTQMNAYMATHY